MTLTYKRIIGAVVLLTTAAVAGWLADPNTPRLTPVILFPLVLVIYGTAWWGFGSLIAPNYFWPKSDD